MSDKCWKNEWPQSRYNRLLSLIIAIDNDIDNDSVAL